MDCDAAGPSGPARVNGSVSLRQSPLWILFQNGFHRLHSSPRAKGIEGFPSVSQKPAPRCVPGPGRFQSSPVRRIVCEFQSKPHSESASGRRSIAREISAVTAPQSDSTDGFPADAAPRPAPRTGELAPPTSEVRAAAEKLQLERRGRSGRMFCNAIVFASSICIMALELTASRLIAQHLGASLYTWTSVIGVVLAGLSVGNFLGGWLADRYPPAKTLAWLFLASGLLTFSVLWFNQWAATQRHPEWVGWQLWVILVVSWIFLLPSIALGTISPVAASLALSFSQKTGSTVGNVYAWGTLGSILGTFLTGFVLIDQLGSHAIIQLVSGALLLMGALVAAGQTVFRVAVVLGALQFVGWCGVSAWATEAKFETLGTATARLFRPFVKKGERVEHEARWERWGGRLGSTLHDLGRVLHLRGDDPGEYNDESNYFAVNVAETTVDGDRVKELKLDHLLHSYWNPKEPYKLHYDYERVYAAVTERAASQRQRTERVTLDLLPVPPQVFDAKRPASVRYLVASRELEVTGALSETDFQALLALGPYGDFWRAMWSLWEQSSGDAGGFLTVDLKTLPEGVTFDNIVDRTDPEPASPFQPPKLRFDAELESLILTGKLSFDEALLAMSQGPYAGYVRALTDLYRRSRQVRTLFIGGGGFVFPRWIESKFPGLPVIDVAEIDPAVKLAVQKEMGLAPDGETAIQTHIGDARKYVDDRVAENARLVSAGKAPRLYDFAYGDAFNDFSVPWHLTTREFSTQIRQLLDPQTGVYLVNIIDIYTRAEFPPATQVAARAETLCGELPPEGLFTSTLAPGKPVAAPKFPGLTGELTTDGSLKLVYVGEMSLATRDRLLALAPETSALYRESIRVLAAQCQARQTLPAPIPEPLLPKGNEFSSDWLPAAAPFASFEVKSSGGGYLLGYRGAMTDSARDALLAKLPADSPWRTAVSELQKQSQAEQAGRFLGRYVRTAREVFPYVYVFSSNEDRPGEDRDTFVVACSLVPLALDNLIAAGGHWQGEPFAWSTREGDRTTDHGQMDALLELSRGLSLTDDYAPVDNLLAPVFTRQ